MNLLTTVKIESPDCFWDQLFSDEELDEIIRYCETFDLSSGKLDFDEENSLVRKSNIAWINRNQDNNWIFSRIEFAVNKLNTKFFGFDIFHLDVLQYTLYDEEGSHYDWHWDIYQSNPMDSVDAPIQRKISAVLQLSNPEEYEGGDLEISPGGSIKITQKKKGFMTVFPSFVVHKVTPVTIGKRKTLVAWFTGPDWR